MNEDEVIEGTINYLKDKLKKRDGLKYKYAKAKKGDHGVDIFFQTFSGNKVSNRYYIEAKGTLKAKDDSTKKSRFNTEFRWAVSQIVLRMKEWSHATNYGIAIPETEKDRCLKLIQDNKGLKILGVRLYLAYKDSDGKLFAKEMTPSKIYN